MKPTVAVVGLGLIGGSLARALTRAGYTVIGVDRKRARAALTYNPPLSPCCRPVSSGRSSALPGSRVAV